MRNSSLPITRTGRDDLVSLTNLETFIAAAARGSMAGGARALGVSTAAVTIAIKRLERQLGEPLFDGSRPKRLTVAGEQLRARIEPLLGQLRRELDRPLSNESPVPFRPVLVEDRERRSEAA